MEKYINWLDFLFNNVKIELWLFGIIMLISFFVWKKLWYDKRRKEISDKIKKWKEKAKIKKVLSIVLILLLFVVVLGFGFWFFK